jgi:hypothetical protein
MPCGKTSLFSFLAMQVGRLRDVLMYTFISILFYLRAERYVHIFREIQGNILCKDYVKRSLVDPDPVGSELFGRSQILVFTYDHISTFLVCVNAIHTNL